MRTEVVWKESQGKGEGKKVEMGREYDMRSGDGNFCGRSRGTVAVVTGT
jgi:hypothetical protein